MAEQKGCLTGALSDTNAAGGVLSLANPEGVDLIITRFVIDVTTPATGAANCDFGVGATGATSDDTLIDGVDIGTAAILADNIENGGTNGLACVAWDSDEFVTGSPSADPADLVGNYYIEYIRK